MANKYIDIEILKILNTILKYNLSDDLKRIDELLSRIIKIRKKLART